MRKSLEDARRQLERTLEKSGYNKLKAVHGKSKRPDFPDLSVGDHRQRYPSSNGVGNGLAKPTAASHPDAKQFPVGHSHKQGLELITNPADLPYMGGKKT